MKYKIEITSQPKRKFFSTITKEKTSRKWYVNDFLHRLDGPACEYNNGHKEWYFEGYYIPDEDDKD
jgi:hypothetical protein